MNIEKCPFVDTTPPIINLTNTNSDWSNLPISTDITASDSGSTLAEIRYSFDTNDLNVNYDAGGTSIPTNTTLNIPIGAHQLYVCARDSIGNVSNIVGDFKWENILPELSATNSSLDW